MISVIAKSVVKQDKISEFLELAKKLVIETRKEQGCIEYNLVQSKEDERVFVFIEKWENQHFCDAHFDMPHFKELFPQLHALRDDRSLEMFTPIDI